VRPDLDEAVAVPEKSTRPSVVSIISVQSSAWTAFAIPVTGVPSLYSSCWTMPDPVLTGRPFESLANFVASPVSHTVPSSSVQTIIASLRKSETHTGLPGRSPPIRVNLLTSLADVTSPGMARTLALCLPAPHQFPAVSSIT